MKFKKGDLVSRIVYSTSQPKGKTYEVIDAKSDGLICVINDNGHKELFDGKYFELVEQALTVEELCDWLRHNRRNRIDAILLYGDGSANSSDVNDEFTDLVDVDSIEELTKLVRTPKKTETELKIEELEKQAEDLKQTIKQLRSTL